MDPTHKGSAFSFNQNSSVTHTRGVWVYPYPLTLNNFNSDHQFMILDIEGMDGIRNDKVNAKY